ncbi:transketolase [Nocardia sp. NRRL S-836]|uniref:transketolase n=1 Tax=Nocardia sp. NRRL S-836 TaxID=1519492 RepID=UPI0006AD8D56|nr:transketolase [Nocardia sp. NRRL S-836]KOV78026.1 transketolase [Nocardia sp. NRRL S-836]
MTTPLAAKALHNREQILRMGSSPSGTHVGGSLSCVDVLTVLYNEVLTLRPDEPDWPERDRFILSKGHASAALYAVLASAGFLPESELDTYAATGGRLAGHPLRRLPGVEFPSGSLGHGLSLGAGIALAAKRAGHAYRAFVLMGDGELQEGSVWEAAQFAPAAGLDNLVAVVDRNGWQITGRTEDLGLEPLADRWRSFGWTAVEVDGHDLDALREVFTSLEPGRPTAVIARTVKGKGVPLFEDKKKSHHVTLTPALLTRAQAGLRARARRTP